MFNIEDKHKEEINILLHHKLFKKSYVTKDKKNLENYRYSDAIDNEESLINSEYKMYCTKYSTNELNIIFKDKEEYEKKLFEKAFIIIFQKEALNQVTASVLLSTLASSCITSKELKIAAYLACSDEYAQMSDKFFIINQNELLVAYNYHHFTSTELKQSHISRFLKSLVEKDILERLDNHYRFKLFDDLV
ncbi:hypothetical protein [Colwellia sp. MB3u-4]|jgi:DNA-binding MarR family transcriptional regulator|uniref:hypothetical protein n=1 Tax=Colwellia sp. MB3u-4 TaxID=2759822 RepID=UPI0015F77D5C|nr:hypothetical protein [Colwellia sp. MB3u-4]MBA6287764.1 hypothetical protein [Colwellia sp. MB3u-4]